MRKRCFLPELRCMEEKTTSLGRLHVGRHEELFAQLAAILNGRTSAERNGLPIGLTGGSTPLAFFRWAAAKEPFTDEFLSRAIWSVSDERMVPLENEESNFGNADRELLQLLNVPEEQKLPFPVQVDPHSAATAFDRRFRERFGTTAFSVCLLGMGADGHTASIFPGSPLLVIEADNFFAPVDVPGKGWRLSITPLGLKASHRIVLMVTGANKADRLAEVFSTDPDPGRLPVQLLHRHAERTDWLVDEAAAAKLF